MIKKRRYIVLMLIIGLIIGGGLLAMNVPWLPSKANIAQSAYIHFSIDDSNSIFEDITIHKDQYTSIFDNPKLNFIKNLHDQYGIVVSFYVFYSWDIDSEKFCLADATDAFQQDFIENADWLRFGFHAKDAPAYETVTAQEELDYYNMTITELLRITGSSKCIDNYVRLDRFFATDEMIALLSETDEGIIGLLTADDPKRQSYALSEEQMNALYRDDGFKDAKGLFYTPTDIRLENIKSNLDFYAKASAIVDQKQIVIFTHESKLENSKVKKYMEWFSIMSKQFGLDCKFPEDMIGEFEE